MLIIIGNKQIDEIFMNNNNLFGVFGGGSPPINAMLNHSPAIQNDADLVIVVSIGL